MTSDHFDDVVKAHTVYRDARWHRSAYFEKLAILDGGTVALVVTAVLTPLRGNVGHSHRLLLASGIACLVVAVLALLVRNLASTEIEFHFAAEILRPADIVGSATRKRQQKLARWLQMSEWIGVALSTTGMLVLGIEACLIVYGRG